MANTAILSAQTQPLQGLRLSFLNEARPSRARLLEESRDSWSDVWLHSSAVHTVGGQLNIGQGINKWLTPCWEGTLGQEPSWTGEWARIFYTWRHKGLQAGVGGQ